MDTALTWGGTRPYSDAICRRGALMIDTQSVRTKIKLMRALVRDGRERISALRPAWGVHLADETMCRLSEAIDAIEHEIGPVTGETAGAHPQEICPRGGTGML